MTERALRLEAARASLECPDGHGLAPFEIKRGFSILCDCCMITFTRKTAPIFYGCRNCDFDLCGLCYQVGRRCENALARLALSLRPQARNHNGYITICALLHSQDLGNYPPLLEPGAELIENTTPWLPAQTPRRAALRAMVVQRRQVCGSLTTMMTNFNTQQ